MCECANVYVLHWFATILTQLTTNFYQQCFAGFVSSLRVSCSLFKKKMNLLRLVSICVQLIVTDDAVLTTTFFVIVHNPLFVGFILCLFHPLFVFSISYFWPFLLTHRCSYV